MFVVVPFHLGENLMTAAVRAIDENRLHSSSDCFRLVSHPHVRTMSAVGTFRQGTSALTTGGKMLRLWAGSAERRWSFSALRAGCARRNRHVRHALSQLAFSTRTESYLRI